jgi:hypothetical protein
LLVIQIEAIYGVDMALCGIKHVTRVMEAAVLVFRSKEFMEYAANMALCGIIHITRFMDTGAGFQAILRFCFTDLRGCNVSVQIEGIYGVCC